METGEESLRLAQDRRPALILMDIRLLGIDGIEALRRLRADPTTQGIPVMAITASIMTAGPEEMRAAGFDGYQSKPLQVTEFLAPPRPPGGGADVAIASGNNPDVCRVREQAGRES